MPADDDQVGTLDGCSVGAAVPWAEGEGVVGLAFGRVEVTPWCGEAGSEDAARPEHAGFAEVVGVVLCGGKQVGEQRSDMHAQSRAEALEGGDGIDR